MGLANGTLYPALSVLLACWVPEKERGKLASFVLGGAQVIFKKFNKIQTSQINFQNFLDWIPHFILCVWIDSLSFLLAHCILFLEHCGCNLVHCVCRFLKIESFVDVHKYKS